MHNGLEGHLIRRPTDRYGGLTLWWQQDGTTVSLRGPAVSEDDLVKIAASVSKTADPGPTESVNVRPTATPIPPPSFALLRPSWLPEPMTAREEYRQLPTPDGPVSSATLHFDAASGATPRDALTLLERPRDLAPDPANGAGGPPETIGERAVRIGRRGDACMNLSWVQGDVALTLVNSYDADGHARYSCEQLRRVVESIR